MLTLPPSRVKRPSLASTTVPINIPESSKPGYWVVEYPKTSDVIYRPGERTSGIAINGGTRVVVQGGHITLSNPGPLVDGKWALNSPPGTNQLGAYRRSFEAVNQVDVSNAVVHVEGLHATGPCLSEGAQTNTPARVQFVYCRWDHLIEQDPVGDTDNHSDAIQCMRADRGVKISRCAAVTDMQGFMLKYETTMGAKPYAFVEIDNTLFHGGDHGDYIFNLVYATSPKQRYENDCIIPSKDKIRQFGSLETAFGHSIAPSITSASNPAKIITDQSTGYLLARWPTLEANGTITQVDKGVYCDPAMLSLTPEQCLERWLPASLIGENYVP